MSKFKTHICPLGKKMPKPLYDIKENIRVAHKYCANNCEYYRKTCSLTGESK